VPARDRERAWSTYARVGICADGKISAFRRKGLTDLAALTRDNPTMRTVAVIFALALITIAFEIYSDAALTSAEVSHTAAPVPATVAMSHGLKHG
jgi:hypothetical protein